MAGEHNLGDSLALGQSVGQWKDPADWGTGEGQFRWKDVSRGQTELKLYS